MLPGIRLAVVTALVFSLSAMAAAAVPAPSTAEPPLSVETFFQPDTVQAVQVSPSGRWMAIQARDPGARNKLTIIDLEGKEPARIVAKFTRFDVEDCR